jgi:hypothetical protein
MKPSGQLGRSGIERKTPMHRGTKGLAPGKPLERGGQPLRRKKRLEPGPGALARRTELKRKATPAAAAAPVRNGTLEPSAKPKKRQRYTGPSEAVKDALRKRARGLCERCGQRPGKDPHHRLARKMGGTKRPWINKLSNLLLLDRRCHDEITNTNGHRTEYEDAGWVLREGMEPGLTPVWMWYRGVWGDWLLDDAGGAVPAPKEAA